ncbi:MAG TPA: hypothetical protein VEL76_21875 [Gemmataceae bacterium]|nr:hypothetical protein [Gemmataceae bacterium]
MPRRSKPLEKPSLSGILPQDQTKVVQPALCELDKWELGNIAWVHILESLPPADRQEVLRSWYEDHERVTRPKEAEARRFFCKPGKRFDPSLFVERLKGLHYVPQVLLSRESAASAYRFLVSLAGGLGPAPEAHRLDPGAADFFKERKQWLQGFCERFCSVFRPSCYTAYFRNASQNRTCLLASGGLRVPEAMRSFNRLEDLPTRVLLAEEELLVFPPFPAGSGKPTSPGTFVQREQVLQEYTLAFRFSWGSTRIAIFLCWREEDHKRQAREVRAWRDWKTRETKQASGGDGGPTGEDPAPTANQTGNPEETGGSDGPLAAESAGDSERVENQWQTLLRLALQDDLVTIREQLRTCYAAVDAGPAAREVVRPLVFAARYVQGWLAASGIDLCHEQDTPFHTHFNLHGLICSFAGAARAHQEDTRQNLLAKAIEQALEAQDLRCLVHHVDRSDPRKPVLVLQKGKYLDIPDEQPRFPLALNNDGFVERSLCAQAAAWNVSLLLTDLNHEQEPSQPGPWWRKILLKTADFRRPRYDSELAVPMISSCDQGSVHVEGVVNVQSRARLNEGHLRRAELAVNLFQKLFCALHAKSLTEQDRAALDDLISTVHAMPTFQRLSKRYCEWVREKLDADIVYLCLFDARRDLFRPMGITLKDRVVEQFFEHAEGGTYLGLDRYDDEQRRAAVKHYQESGGARGFIHHLAEHAMSSRLLPRHGHETYEVFRKNAPRLLDPSHHAGRDTGPSADYSKTRLLLPFALDRHGPPDGVLWICWQNDPPASLTQGLPTNNPEAFMNKIQKDLRLLSEAVAAMCSLHRFHDADRVAESLPL